MILIIKQTLLSGKSKTWKLRPAQKQYSFGASRLADLISMDPQSPGIESLFVFEKNKWCHIPLTEQVFHQQDTKAQIELKQGDSLRLGSSTLTIEIVEKPTEWTQNIISKSYQDGESESELLVIKKDGQILSTRVFASAKELEAEIKNHWNHDIYEVVRKKIKTLNTEGITKIGVNDIVDKESQRQVGIVLGLTSILVLGGLFGPKTPQTMVQAPKRTQSIVIRTEVKPKEQPKEKAPQVVQQVAEVPTAPSKPSGRVADKVKSLAGGRISQLLGKVSAQAAKSGNIFIGKGVQAGSANSGRALAAVGAIDRGGSAFGTGAGEGVTVSTAGRGGGKAVSGMGGLAAGRTGAGGIGLIEEESEISGGLDREVIAAYIKSQLGNILYCYERQLSAQPDLFGKVAVKFTIGPTGSIEARSIGDSTLKNSTVEGCILQKVAAWKFPSPQGGTRVMVTYPFLFKSTN